MANECHRRSNWSILAFHEACKGIFSSPRGRHFKDLKAESFELGPQFEERFGLCRWFIAEIE